MSFKNRLATAIDLQDKILSKKKQSATDMVIMGDLRLLLMLETQVTFATVFQTPAVEQIEKNQDMILQNIVDKYNRYESKQQSKSMLS